MSGSRFFSTILLLAVVALPVSANDPLTNGAPNTADFPAFREDVSGNLHLLWQDDTVDSGAILYRMFNSVGDLLIDTTQANDGGTGQPAITPAVDVNVSGQLFVVWHESSDQEVWFMRLNPFLDDLSGDVADLMTIKEIGDIRISAAGGFDAIDPRILVDANGDLHVVWDSSNGGSVQYAKLDADGVVLQGPLSIGGVSNGSARPDLSLDSGGNVHIVFGNAAATTANEVYYAMIDGTTGAILIDATLLSVDDGLRADSATINVDTFDNTAYVVLAQSLTGAVNGDEEIFMWALDPSLDDQDGSATSAAAIRTDEHQLTSGEGMFRWSVTSRIAGDRRIHATYVDFDQGSCPGAAVYDINDAHITFAGNIVAKSVVSSTGSATTCFPQAKTAPGDNRIVWTDSSTGTREIFALVFSRADAGSSGFTCSLGRPANAWQAGDAWLLMLAVMLLGVARRYRVF